MPNSRYFPYILQFGRQPPYRSQPLVPASNSFLVLPSLRLSSSMLPYLLSPDMLFEVNCGIPGSSHKPASGGSRRSAKENEHTTQRTSQSVFAINAPHHWHSTSSPTAIGTIMAQTPGANKLSLSHFCKHTLCNKKNIHHASKPHLFPELTSSLCRHPSNKPKTANHSQ